jgi:glutamate-5-semialdehyde dehydrogenase
MNRPDVTVEAGGIAFKSGNKILLKGGKESLLILKLWAFGIKPWLTKNGFFSIWTIIEWDNFLKNQRKK